MVKKQTTTQGFAILSFAGILNKILAVVYVPVLTLLIDDFGNGIYNAGYSIYFLIFVITNTGIPIAISKLVSEQIALGSYQDSYKTLKISGTVLVALGFITSVGMAFFAPNLSRAVGWPEAYLTILALSPTLFFAAISCAFRGYFQGRSNMFPTGVSQFIEQLLNTVLTILFAWLMLKYGYHYALIHGIQDQFEIKLIALEFAAAGGTVGTSVGALGSAMYLAYVYMKHRKEILQEAKNENSNKNYDGGKIILKKLIQYSLPVTIGFIAIYAANLIDLKYTKTRLISAGFNQYDANSLYGILTTQFQKVINIPLAVSYALAAAIIPSVSAASAVKDTALLGKKINESLRATMIITLPAALGLAILAKPIITLLFPKNIHGWDLLMVGSGVLVLISVVQVQTAILQGIGRTHLPTIHMIIALMIKIAVNYHLIAIKTINIKGAVIGSILCYALAGCLNHISIIRYTKVELDLRKVFMRPFISSLIMGMMVLIFFGFIKSLLVNWMNSFYLINLFCTIASVLIGGAVYFISMLWFKGITRTDLDKLPMGDRINLFIGKFAMIKRLLAKDG